MTASPSMGMCRANYRMASKQQTGGEGLGGDPSDAPSLPQRVCLAVKPAMRIDDHQRVRIRPGTECDDHYLSRDELFFLIFCFSPAESPNTFRSNNNISRASGPYILMLRR